MSGQGTLIAASRRTFFDTHDYLKRTTLLKSNLPYDINFNELKLKDWDEKEIIEYFANLEFEDSQKTYDCIVAELHDKNHPILTRPFLLTKLASAIQGKDDLIPTFFSKTGNPNEGVSLIVEAFTLREVDKWKERDSNTGKPYLSFDQHIKFLQEISLAMWESKRDYVTIEEMEYYAALLISDWGIDETIKPIIMRMVKTHAFLVPIEESKFEYRKFDHEEFKNYFLARALADLINNSLEKESYINLAKFLYIDQLSDSVAMYCFNYVNDLNNKVDQLIVSFKQMIESEYKPTYLQMNIGTLFPFLIDKIPFETPIHFDSKVNYTSLVFENKNLKNITFENGNFINISLRNTDLENVHFINCSFTEIKIDLSSSNRFKDVSYKDCQVNSIILLQEAEVREIAYAPHRVKELLLQSGIKIQNEEQLPTLSVTELLNHKSEFKKALNRFILKFNKMTIQYEINIINEKYLGNNIELIIEDVIPLCEEYNVIESIETKQSRQSGSRAWRLLVEMQDLLKYDGEKSDYSLAKFWEIVNSKE